MGRMMRTFSIDVREAMALAEIRKHVDFAAGTEAELRIRALLKSTKSIAEDDDISDAQRASVLAKNETDFVADVAPEGRAVAVDVAKFASEKCREWRAARKRFETIRKTAANLSTPEDLAEEHRRTKATRRRASLAQAVQARHRASALHPDAQAILNRPVEDFMDDEEDDESLEKRLLKGRTMTQPTAKAFSDMLVDYAEAQCKDGETVAKAHLRLVQTDRFAKSMLATHQALVRAERNGGGQIAKHAQAGDVHQDMNAIAADIRKREPHLKESEVLAKAYAASKSAAGRGVQFDSGIRKIRADSATSEVQERADTIRQQNPKLTAAQAFARAHEEMTRDSATRDIAKRAVRESAFEPLDAA